MPWALGREIDDNIKYMIIYEKESTTNFWQVFADQYEKMRLVTVALAAGFSGNS